MVTERRLDMQMFVAPDWCFGFIHLVSLNIAAVGTSPFISMALDANRRSFVPEDAHLRLLSHLHGFGISKALIAMTMTLTFFRSSLSLRKRKIGPGWADQEEGRQISGLEALGPCPSIWVNIQKADSSECGTYRWVVMNRLIDLREVISSIRLKAGLLGTGI